MEDYCMRQFYNNDFDWMHPPSGGSELPPSQGSDNHIGDLMQNLMPQDFHRVFSRSHMGLYYIMETPDQNRIGPVSVVLHHVEGHVVSRFILNKSKKITHMKASKHSSIISGFFFIGQMIIDSQ